MKRAEQFIFHGGGDMGERMRAFAWEATSLGPAAAWPASLRALVGVTLASKQPMYVAWGPDLVMIYNDAYASLMGVKHPAGLGQPFLEVWREVRDDLTPLVDQVFAGEPVHMDDITLMVDRDGTRREAHFAFSYTPVRNEAGQVVGLLCPCTDTTAAVFADRRQAFRLKLEEALHGLAAPSAIVMTAVHALGQHLGVNRVGYGEMLEDGQTMRLSSGFEEGVLSNSGSLVHLDGFGEEAANRQRRGLTTWSEDVHGEAGYDVAHWNRIETRAFVSVPLVRDGALKAVLYVNTREPRRWSPEDVALIEGVASRVWDAVERAQAEDALRASEAQFSTLTQALPNQVWTARPDGTVDWLNTRTHDYLGLAAANNTVQDWTGGIHPDDVPAAVGRWRAARDTGTVYEAEFRIRRHDGAFRWFIARAVPLHDPEGGVTRWVGTNTDIHDQKMAELEVMAAKEQAEAANLAKSTFIANMSHELRTPLSAIIGYSEMILEELEEGGEDGLAGDIRKVEGNARHLLGLINDVLDLSKIESGKMEVFAEDFAIGPTAREIAATVQTLVDKKRNRLELQLDPGLGVMHSDVTKIRQVLLNLLSNAAKFCEDGTITLRIAPDMSGPVASVAFRVSDTGIGMTEAQVARLFQRFTQADSSTTRKFGGTGLGLSLTKAFADMLGGRVAVDSVEGQGTSFTVTVPLRYRPRDPQPEVVVDEPGAAPPGGDHDNRDLVLVIDDDPSQRALMTRFLTREGFRSQAAADGRTGLHLASTLKPRAILLDVMMPGIDGWSVLSALKKDPDLADIPVVMVTFVEQRALAASLGAADYVMKPVQWDRFKAVMDRFRPPENDVLVIEDDPDTRARLRTMLERDGWSVTEAADGQEGLDRLAAKRPGIVLLDLTMPKMDGFDFFRHMRERPECAAIPVVVLTALDLTRDDRRRLAGTNQILNKGDTSLQTLGSRLHQLATQPHPKAAADGG